MCPKIVTGIQSEIERQEIHKATKELVFPSKLECFRKHNGIRPCEFTAIVSRQGNGKSALVKTIAMEAAMANLKSYILLSEEKSAVYKGDIINAVEKYTGKGRDYFLKNVYLDSMLDWTREEKNPKNFLAYIEKQINEYQPEVLLFDNFTTSFVGSLPINRQGDIIEGLREIAADYELAVVGVFHTEKGTDEYKEIISGEKVRGNQTATNLASYIYILTTYFSVKPPQAFLTVEKARYHANVNKTVWKLKYDLESRIYDGAFLSSRNELDATRRAINENSKRQVNTKLEELFGKKN